MIFLQVAESLNVRAIASATLTSEIVAILCKSTLKLLESSSIGVLYLLSLLVNLIFVCKCSTCTFTHVKFTHLTAFGDSDGNHFEAKLQHPLAVTWSNHHEILYVADTYNHKVKILNQTDDGMWTCRTLVGSGKKGNRDCAFSEATFNHPSCVVEISRYRLLVCDSFSHSIRDIDLEAKIVSTLELN